MKHIVKFQIVGLALLSLAVTAFAEASNPVSIIPAPQKVTSQEGVFKLQSKSRIITDSASRETGNYLAERLRKSTGYKIAVETSGKPEAGDIELTTKDAKTGLGAEGYELTVTKDTVVIRAPEQAGLFYGAQSLLQLLPADIFSAKAVSGVEWQAPCVQIEDQPRFAWRGMMLDVSRHFFTKDEVKQVLDALAFQKMNVFHWHLVDDQGWRIEIKKYPKLTSVGAWRKETGFKMDPKASTTYGPDGQYGGFYTQDDIREVVAYAKSLHITIVPEIEMPGHACAALQAYPEFSCNGKTHTGEPITTPMVGGIFDGVYCAGNDKSFEFVQDVLTEVFELFPGKYVHIGGDEVTVDNWKACPKCQARMKEEKLTKEIELESYFIRRVEKFINSKGRSLIGWSEIREGGLAENAAIMDWIGGSVESASSGHKVVMTPTTHCYFDQYQSQDHTTEPYAIGGFTPLKRVYAFEPIPSKLDAKFRENILGPQANLWTEYMPNLKHVEYMTFPRLTALSEVAWSPKDARNWDDFSRRLADECRRFDELGINYRHLQPAAAAANDSK